MILSNNLVKQLIGLVLIAVLFEGCNTKPQTPIVVGKLRASSYARIIEKREHGYKVESPVNQVQGWISNEHVKTTSWKNPKTKKLCKAAEKSDLDCVEFVALWAAGDIAERIGKDRKWVFLNYTVDIWDILPAKVTGN